MSTSRPTTDAGALRLLAACVVFALGVVAGEAVALGMVAAAALVVGVGALAVVSRTTGGALAVVLVLAVALTSGRIASLERSVLAEEAAKGTTATLTGQALTDGRIARGATRFVMAVASVDRGDAPARIRERALVTIRSALAIDAGSRLLVTARLAPREFPDMDEVGRASARRLFHQGVAARAFGRDVDVDLIGPSTQPLMVAANAGRAAVRRAASLLTPRAEGLLLGITIGDVSRLPPDVDVDFRIAGLSHLVAVSGANVAMVLLLVALALRWLRATRRTSSAVLVATLLVFMGVTRFEPSVMRAGVMAGVALIGVVVGASHATMRALGAAVLILLVHDPFMIYSVGFQLSAAATAGIVVVGPRVRERLPPGRLAAGAAVTAGAQIAVLPLLVLHFHQLSVVAIAANLLVAPVIAPATMLGFIAAIAGSLAPWAAGIVVVAEPLLAWTRWVSSSLASLPLAQVRIPGGPAGFVLIASALVVGRVLLRERRRLAGVTVVLLIAGVVTWSAAIEPSARLDGLVVEMIDVGQGESILIRSGAATMLVDGGPDPTGIVRALRERRIPRIDVLVVTHPHEDHVAGLPAVAATMPVGSVVDPMLEDDLASYADLRAVLDRTGVHVERARAGQTFALGSAEVDVLWPPDERVRDTGSDLNNNSIVLRVRYGDDAVLLAGETEEAAQEALMRAGEDLSAGVLKVSHHGSARMVPDFYRAVGARIAMIPVGTNPFGHPAPSTLAALEGATIMRSDLHGDVAVAMDGRGSLTVA